MVSSSGSRFALASFALLGIASVVAAHGHDEHIDPNPIIPSMGNSSEPESYFQHGEHSTWVVSHIILMTVAWVFILPVGVMLSISRSVYSKMAQIGFLTFNGVGIFTAVIYNANTPDLYPKNAHHKLGWVLTATAISQFFMGVLNSFARRNKKHAFIPVSQSAVAEHLRLYSLGTDYSRYSHDSGHGTDANTASRSPSCSDSGVHSPVSQDADDEEEQIPDLRSNRNFDKLLTKFLPETLPSRLLRVMDFVYNVVDRFILLPGFAALCTGWITYGGIFKGEAVFSGLAHFIKGGVFFWFGILTLGRWAGCFADIGWAWNIKPPGVKANKPTAEFVESFLIFLYGSTNVFLEHLAAWGKEWTAMDLEHISLTVMFFGGGLCGMLIESKKLRGLLNTRQENPMSQLHFSADKEELEEPTSYRSSMNPIPALVIFLLGIMMSSHHQESMVSTMIHAQWGNLLVGAAFARGATQILNYLSPPKSILPGRPPTELVTAFCFMAGGLIFMASARDVVKTIEMHKLDAMFVFTVSMGLVTFLMAWVIAVIAIKGWAVRKENKAYTYV